jgi:hypothetical protein
MGDPRDTRRTVGNKGGRETPGGPEGTTGIQEKPGGAEGKHEGSEWAARPEGPNIKSYYT